MIKKMHAVSNSIGMCVIQNVVVGFHQRRRTQNKHPFDQCFLASLPPYYFPSPPTYTQIIILLSFTHVLVISEKTPPFTTPIFSRHHHRAPAPFASCNKRISCRWLLALFQAYDLNQLIFQVLCRSVRRMEALPHVTL